MALGQFSDINLAAAATLTGGAWSADLPLANLTDDAGYVAAPARQLAPSDLSASRFDAALARSRPVSLLALLFHTLSMGASYRITLASEEGWFDAPAYAGDWTPVYGRVFASEDLEWEDANWWLGQLLPEDIDLYPRHLFVRVSPRRICVAVRVEIDDRETTAGYFDLGGLWIADSWSPLFNVDRGRTLSNAPRDLIDEAPSGRQFGEERTPRRTLAISWSALSDAEAYRLADTTARVRSTGPVIFVPDFDDPLSLAREAFPARLSSPPAPKLNYDGSNVVAATIKEIVA